MFLYKDTLDTVAPSYVATSDATAPPVMLNRLAEIDIVALDAAVSTGLPGERAKRLIKNRGHVASQKLPKLLITVHSAEELWNAQVAAEQLRP